MERWTTEAVPDQTGRTAVVTGANSGIGLETAIVLAAHGATVVLACRDVGRGEQAAERVQAAGGRDARVVRLDLASQASVREAAGEIRAALPRLDLLINNAGVMDVPRQLTEDGFELTLAANHLGHFALTGLLLDRLLATPESRVVNVSSISHRQGAMHFDDLQLEQGYDPSSAYARSKLANLLFTYGLDARLRAAGAGTIALAVHPGIARTELFRETTVSRVLISRWLRPLLFWLAQDAWRGALPTLRAATDPAARGGEYYGPSGLFEFTGHPVTVASNDRSHDAADQQRLWEISERLTGVTYEGLSGAVR